MADTYNNRIQKFNSSGVYQSQFGSEGTSNGQFSYHRGITIDSSGNIYVADTGNSRIQKFTDTPDSTAPIISETTAVTTPSTDTTPSYTFTTDEAGTITYGGDCTSATTSAASGSNTLTFNTLTDGTHSNCTITVTDTSSNVSNILTVNSFTVDTTGPTITLTGSTPVTVEVGTVYTDAGATATDTQDGDRTANIITVNPVNTNTVSSYTVTYNVSDTLGNPATQVTRTVNVVDTTGPVYSNLAIVTTDERASISFDTDELAVSELSYTVKQGKKTKVVTIPITKQYNTHHEIVMRDMKHCSLYTYTLINKDKQ